MKKITSLIVLIVYGLCSAIAQTGNWSSPNINWSYNMGKPGITSGTTGNNGIVSTSGTVSTFLQNALDKKAVGITGKSPKNFMPLAPSGTTVRILIADARNGKENGTIGLDAATKTFKMNASSVNNSNKLAFYKIAEAKPVAAISFTINFNDAANNGTWGFNVGKNSAVDSKTRLFDGDGKIHPSRVNPDNFASLSWNLSSKEDIVFSYRTSDDRRAAEKKDITSSPFKKGGTYTVELYCNNTENTQTYQISAQTYQLPPRTYHIWVDQTQLEFGSGKKDFPASVGELEANTELSAFSFLGYANTLPKPNSAEIILKDLAVKYTAGTSGGE